MSQQLDGEVAVSDGERVTQVRKTRVEAIWGAAETARAASNEISKRRETRRLQKLRTSKFDVDDKVSDRGIMKADVWAPDQGGKIHSHVSVSPRAGGPCQGNTPHRPIAIVQCYCLSNIHLLAFYCWANPH